MQQPTRREQVSEIMRINDEAFAVHASNPANKRSLLIPVDERHQSPIADALMISRRILHEARDPYAIHARVAYSSTDRLRLFVAERMPTPVSNPIEASAYQRAVILGDTPEATPGLDQMLPPYAIEHILGIVSPRDLIYQYLAVSAEAMLVGKRSNSMVYVDLFMDRDDMRGRGLAEGMYRRGKRGFRALGFDYIVGQNDPENVSFFINKLGRKRYTELPTELKDALVEVLEIIEEPENFTVDIINPYLRRKYKELFLRS